MKDPFRTAAAVRLLPPTSRIEVLQIGGALSPEMRDRARSEESSNPRYRWLGEYPRWKALRILARARLLVLTSLMEGGANVVSEALACAVPVLSSMISGSIGILGEDYPGYFPAEDTSALAKLMARAEGDPEFYRDLKRRCKRLAPLVSPTREREGWNNLLLELSQ